MTGDYPKTSLLLQQWNAGQEEALGQLFESHGDWLLRTVRKSMSQVLRNRYDSMDFVQEAIKEFLEGAPRFEIENGKLFRGLLFKIVQNKTREEYRWWRAKRRDLARERPIPDETVLHPESPSLTPGDKAAENEKQALVRFALEFMKPEEQKVIVLREFDSLSFSAIGEELRKSEDAARMQHNRAIQELGTTVGMLRRGQLEKLLGQQGPEGAEDCEEPGEPGEQEQSSD